MTHALGSDISDISGKSNIADDCDLRPSGAPLPIREKVRTLTPPHEQDSCHNTRQSLINSEVGEFARAEPRFWNHRNDLMAIRRKI